MFDVESLEGIWALLLVLDSSLVVLCKLNMKKNGSVRIEVIDTLEKGSALALFHSVG